MNKIIFLYFILYSTFLYSQCNSFTGCNPNNGLYSGNDPENIEYDNLIVTYHTSLIKDVFNNYKIWGELAAANGKDHIFTPQYINSTNYPKLTGNILKATIGSAGYIQLFVLTTDGLFVSGDPGRVIPKIIKPTSEFEKISVNGKPDGLPPGVLPSDVKMMFATTGSLTITTCSGYVYVLSENPYSRGNGKSGSETEWAQVMENTTTPLSDIIVARGQSKNGFALKKDGTIWTWGYGAYSGNNFSGHIQTFDFATKMVFPTGANGVKMIQATTSFSNNYISYYLLDQSNTLYCLGFNNDKQLGSPSEFPSTTGPFQKIWMVAKYPNGKIMNDIAWVSSNEADYTTAAVSVINKKGEVYNAGDNARKMLARDVNNVSYYFGKPNGIKSTDIITSCETGAHCTAITKKGTDHYGYAGHRYNGSMGNSDPNEGEESTYNFTITPEIYVCGVSCPDPLVENNSPVCFQTDASFSIKSTPNDVITYSLNNEPDETITIDNTGIFEIKIPAAEKSQTLTIKKIKNLICGEKKLNIISNSALINNSDIRVTETGNNTINITIENGTPDYLYQLLDYNDDVIYSWQSSNIFTDLKSNYYKIQVKTSGTECISVINFVYLNLPNVITPNSDGVNDKLPIDFFKNLSNSYLDIYDRFGQKLLHIDKNTTYQDYSKFSTGNYWYIFQDENGNIKNGWIFIKKR